MGKHNMRRVIRGLRGSRPGHSQHKTPSIIRPLAFRHQWPCSPSTVIQPGNDQSLHADGYIHDLHLPLAKLVGRFEYANRINCISIPTTINTVWRDVPGPHRPLRDLTHRLRFHQSFQEVRCRILVPNAISRLPVTKCAPRRNQPVHHRVGNA